MHQASGRFASMARSKTTSGSMPEHRRSSGRAGRGAVDLVRAPAGFPRGRRRRRAPGPSTASRSRRRPCILRRAIANPAGQHGADRRERARGRRPRSSTRRTPPRSAPPPASTTTRRIRSAPSMARSPRRGHDHVAEALAHLLDRPRPPGRGRRASRPRSAGVLVEGGEVVGATTAVRARQSSGLASELPQEADVVLDERRACRRSRGASARTGRCRSRRRSRSTPRGRSRRPSNTAGSTMPQPPSSIQPVWRAGPAARAAADRAGDIELRRRLGEGEVGRAQPRVDVGPK